MTYTDDPASSNFGAVWVLKGWVLGSTQDGVSSVLFDNEGCSKDGSEMVK